MIEPTHISRQKFHGAIGRAYWRWECLRRSGMYRSQADGLIALWAEEFFWKRGHRLDKAGLRAFFLKHQGGVIYPPPTPKGRELYNLVQQQHGLRLVLHPIVEIPIEDMEVLPIFTDTPGRQPVVEDRDLLTKLAMEAHLRRGELPDRTLHQAIKVRKVKPAGFMFRGERVRFDTLRQILDVFDLIEAGLTLKAAADQLGISPSAAYRALERSKILIPGGPTPGGPIQRWDDSLFAAHVETCTACQPWAAGIRTAEPCPAMTRMIEPRRRRKPGERTARAREHLYQGDAGLDLLAARRDGSLPSRPTPARPTT